MKALKAVARLTDEQRAQRRLMAAARVADDLLILKDGRTVAFGPCAEVLTPATLEAAFNMPMDVIDLQGRTAIMPR